MYFAFGKHRDRHVSQVPTGYLQWAVRECECLEPWERDAIEDELRRRQYDQTRRQEPEPDPEHRTLAITIAPVLRQWHQEMVRRFHPDRGGSHDAMVAINFATERLRELVEAA